MIKKWREFIIKNRQLEIILFLNERKKTTIKELAEKFEVSKRTIMRDINVISNLGVPIDTQPGFQGGVSIPSSYKFQQGFFTPNEIEELVMAIHIADRIGQRNEKSRILKKMELLVPELTLLKERDFTDYLQIELFDEPIYSDNSIFKNINRALDEECYLRLQTSTENYYVAPLSYALQTSGLYRYASDGKEKLSLPLSDILYCEVTEQSFNREEYIKFISD